MRFSISLGLSLVTNDDIDVEEDLIKLDFEELRNEWCREVESDSLARRGGNFGDVHSGFNTVSKEETTNVEELGVVDQGLDLRLLEVRDVERFGSSEGGNERSVRAESFPKLAPASHPHPQVASMRQQRSNKRMRTHRL